MSTQSQVFSFITQPGTTGLLRETLPDEWLEMHLFLQTAGAVIVGDTEDLLPVVSDKGMQLPFQISVTFKLSPSSRLYIASTAVNTVAVRLNAIPGLEQILKVIGKAGGVPEPARKATTTEQVDIGKFGFVMPPKRR